MSDRQDSWNIEKHEWHAALANVIQERGEDEARQLLIDLLQSIDYIESSDIFNTPYLNTIHRQEEIPYPGNLDLEQKIENILRWNAAAMVLRAADSGTGVGGHIGTYFSTSTLLEVGFNHFFDRNRGDQVHVQAHASPGVYARAFLEGRLTQKNLENFRREGEQGGGLPSYPHPRRLPEFWTMPTASMGLSTPLGIHQARMIKYLENRGLIEKSDAKIWLFVGDGETDEPEVIGSLSVAAREQLDNLIMVVNCNLQRLDGPVRGNGKIIQELERAYLGAGWHVIKLVWSSDWDVFFERDRSQTLVSRLSEIVDGDYQLYNASSGSVIREHLLGNNEPIIDLFRDCTDDDIKSLRAGGHDPIKIYNAFARAMSVHGQPCVILAKTVKGDGMGSKSVGKNTIHQKKQLTKTERMELAHSLDIPLPEASIAQAEFYQPSEDSPEMEYFQSHLRKAGGGLPVRSVQCKALDAPAKDAFKDLLAGSGDREISTTMSLVRLLQRLLRDKTFGKYIVPIVPDEARTFGMDGLIAQTGIYSPLGQQYTPVDADTIAPYRESTEGQILQEGICEAGAMSAFAAAGTANAMHGVPLVPFYFFYSMFGFQRVGDLIWACGDMMCKGFLIGATSGRTTLNGEGVQHQDGHSHVLASTVPNLRSYDPAFAYEIAVIVREGWKQMFKYHDDMFYYLTVTNQNYRMPAMPENVELGIMKGMYPLDYHQNATINLFGSGAIMTEILSAANTLRELGYSVSVWSVTSYVELQRNALDTVAEDREYNTQGKDTPYVTQLLGEESGIFVAASDYQKSLPLMIAPWVPGEYSVLGTDGYGFSDSREALRSSFAVSADWICYTALHTLNCRTQKVPFEDINRFFDALNLACD
ncbi:MAG: pyruvate dehydrogenase (acetyl-transferring), homodimeric type [Gammaproteobacteria bacterium]|nr:pyruvate dehydrogenase (acetyl-transferring), homodimeric type [Gammaproteobacteria bacterium]MDE0252087.1 pyruvate dehydrogenase (acetyl-transferring), homodimeric type [Gammaproteobacteria bacterium]MDE0402804.1 pyruvate dehydrogenase (acetyl-transferring), homodimeric type [Gammaproteobacteria bacterium]